VVGDAAAEARLHPLRKVHAGIAPGRLDEPEDALVRRLGREVTEVVLKGVWNPAVCEANVRRPLVVVDVVAHDLFEQLVELAVVAEDDVTSEVPGKTLRIDD
jgi:hypothetical protein